jgi:hypothetical protein
MRASTKLIMALALLLSAGSVKLAQSAPYTDVSHPGLWGGGSLGFNRGQSSSLQLSRHYPNGLDPLKGEGYWDIPHGTDVSQPLLWGGGSLGFNRGQSSSLQLSRHYPNGLDPLKGAGYWDIPHGTDVSQPLLWGGGSLGFYRGQSSSLQLSRHYPNGHDPLKADWEITVHHTHH